MRQTLFIATVLLSLLLLSCETNHLSGVYVCDQSTKKADSTIINDTVQESFVDLTCTIQVIEFKGENTVALKMGNGQFVSTYVIDKDYVRIKGTGSDILLKVKDPNTLVGEGFPPGIYHRK